MIGLNMVFKNSLRLVSDAWSHYLPLNKNVAGLKTLEEKVGLPRKPKKPLTPYFRFMQHTRSKILSENPKSNILQVVKMIAKQWETVDPSIKQKLTDEYKKDQLVYVEARAKYDSKVTEEQRSQMKQIKKDEIEAKERRIMKKRIKDLGRPKRPASAFLRFVAEERNRNPISEKENYRSWHAKSAEKWTRLPAADKEVYMQQTQKALEIYRNELKLWEQKMVRLGNVDVVRQETLTDLPETNPKPKSP